jgi:L-arabinonolactonase
MPRADVSVFRDCHNVVGEGPLWDERRGCLWWVDVVGQLLLQAIPGRAETMTWTLDEPPAALALDTAGDLLIACGLELRRFDPVSGAQTLLARHPHPVPGTRFNDGITDARGRFWIGTLHDAREPVGELLRFEDGHGRIVETGLRTQNGCAISPDGLTFYLADSHPDIRTIWAFDFDVETATLTNRRVFHRPERGRPDGAAVDIDGCYWFAAVDGGCIVQLDPQGREIRAIDLPVSRPTKPAFGGERMATLFVTSMSVGTDPGREPLAGAVFAIDAGASGFSPPAFVAGGV